MNATLVTIDALRDVLAPTYAPRTICTIDTHPHDYATSFALTVVTVVLDDGERDVLLMKDFDRANMLPAARHLRRGQPNSPAREIEAYRRVLTSAGIGPRCQASTIDPTRSRHWLFTEKVAGVELWQVGDHTVWEAVACWLGEMHASFVGRADLADLLPTMDRAWFALCHDRAEGTLAASADPRARRLHSLLGRIDLAGRLDAMPRTLVHGEFYPSNVMVGLAGLSRVRVVPIDWETAAVGPPMLDLAALASGWDRATSAGLVRAYGEMFDAEALGWCRLHLSLRMLASPADWIAPDQHSQDWVGEAMRVIEEVSG